MAISLEKRTDAALLSLVKKGEEAEAAGTPLGDVAFQILLVIDYSGSMEFPENQFYTKGDMQELAERMLGLSLTGLDDDGNVQVFPFHNDALDPFVVDATNYRGAIENWRWIKKGMFGKKELRPMGGTSYTAAINAVYGYLNTNNMLAPGKPPVLVLFQTDGGSSTAASDKRLLTQFANLPIFWQFLGLGKNTSFLKELDELPNRAVDNVGAVSLREIGVVDDETFYDTVLEEPLKKWLPAARAAGIVTS